MYYPDFFFWSSSLTIHSSTPPKLRTGGCWNVTRTTPKCCNSWAGCTTSKAATTLVKNKLSSTSRNQWLLVSPVYHCASLVHMLIYDQIKRMHKAGTCLGAATCHSRSTPRRMRPTSKRSTEMVAIRLSGALSACFTTKSTSTVMRLMLTRALSDSTLTSVKCGTTSVLW